MTQAQGDAAINRVLLLGFGMFFVIVALGAVIIVIVCG